MKHYRPNLLSLTSFLASLTIGCNLVAQEMNNETIRDFVGLSSYYYSSKWNDGTNKIFNISCNNSDHFTFGDKEYLQYQCSAFFDAWYDQFFYFRQDGNKIFRYDVETDTEYVAFDFGLQVGDKFTDMKGNDYEVSVVTDTVVVQEFNKEELGTFKKIILDGIGNHDLHDEWLEGLGSLYTGMLNSFDLQGNVLYPSYKVPLDKACLHTVTTSQMRVQMKVDKDFVKGCYAANTISSEDFEIFKKYGYETSFEFEFVGDSLHVVGIIGIPTYNDMYIICFPKGDKIELYYIMIPVGPGVFGTSPYGIDVWFSGFEKGTYLVKFPGCDDVEVVCDGNDSPTSVMDIEKEERQYNPTTIIDLSGRRMKNEPRQGIYIKDGKKYITH